MPRFAVVRLIFFAGVTLLFLALPLLEGADYLPSTMGALLGLVIPVAAKPRIVSSPTRTMAFLRLHSFALTAAIVGKQVLSPPLWFIGVIAALGVSWASIWTVLMTDSEVVPLE